MIQFNLLPDIKLKFIKTRQTKHLVLIIAAIISAVSLVVLALMFSTVSVLQKNHMNNLSKEITDDIKTLKNTPDLEKILTIQNQLNSIGTLHDQKPQLSRLVDYMNQITPATVTIGSMNLTIGTPTLTITGNALDLSTINKFVDTLKFANYSIEGETYVKKPFKDVVLTSFTAASIGVLNISKTGPASASYSISLVYDPILFNRNKKVTLEVPSQITTRSETEKPNLFQASPTITKPDGV